MSKWKRTTIDWYKRSDEVIDYIVQNNIVDEKTYLQNKPKLYPGKMLLKSILKTYGDEKYNLLLNPKGIFTKEDLRSVLRKEGITKCFLFERYRPGLVKKYNKKIPCKWREYYKVDNFNELIGYSLSELFIDQSMSYREIICYKYLFERGVSFETEKTFDGLVGKRKLRFDFYIDHLNLIIELDGEYHKNHPDIIQYDIIKNSYCKENNITLIRIENIEDIIPQLELLFGDIKVVNSFERDYNNLTNLDIINSNLTKSCKARLLFIKNNEVTLEQRRGIKISTKGYNRVKEELITGGFLK